MKLVTSVLLSFFLSFAVLANNSSSTNRFILKNVNVIDVEHQDILTNQNILVENGKIKFITSQSFGKKDQIKTKPNINVIDGKGGYITPGLIDMHVHIYEKAAYALTLSHGVTHVRIMNGVPAQLTWRDQIEQGSLIGSSSSVSSPIISGFQDAYLHRTVLDAESARQSVNEFHNAGYDLIKAYGNLTQPALSALVDESRKLGIPVAKHGPHGSGDMHVSELSGLQSFEHIEDIYQGPLNYERSTDKLPPIIADIKNTQVAITPTLNIFYQLTKISVEKEQYLSKTAKHYTSDIIALEASTNQIERWLNASDNMAKHNLSTLSFLQQITNEFHLAKVPLLVGSDSGVLLSPHGLATHNEMRLLNESGLSTFDVLTAATINGAKALKLDDKIGKIAHQYQADFIYTTTNPIEDLSVLVEPNAVVKHGKWYSAETLKRMRDEAIESRSFWEELSVLMAGL